MRKNELSTANLHPQIKQRPILPGTIEVNQNQLTFRRLGDKAFTLQKIPFNG
jgi:hypothetical protein